MSEVNRIIQDLEFCDSVFDYTLTPDDSGLLLGYIQELEQENQQLKENNKSIMEELLRVVGLYNQQKSVLDEIKEYIIKDLDEPDPEEYREYTVDISWFNDLLQILDKAGKE